MAVSVLPCLSAQNLGGSSSQSIAIIIIAGIISASAQCLVLKHVHDYCNVK